MSIIKKIGGKEVLPVWALPYVMVAGEKALVDFGMAVDSLAHRAGCGNVPKSYLTGYHRKSDGEVVLVRPREWEEHRDIIAMKTEGLKETENHPFQNYERWREEVAKGIPTHAFVYLDEFTHWYCEAIEKNLEYDGTVDGAKHYSQPSVCVPCEREDYAPVLDPMIPEAVMEHHKAWFSTQDIPPVGSVQVLAISGRTGPPGSLLEDGNPSTEQGKAEKPTPAEAIRLRDFLQALEHFHDPKSEVPYYRLPPRTAVYFMLTGQLNGFSPSESKDMANWLEAVEQNSDYRLKLYDEAGHDVKIDADELQGGAKLPEYRRVRLNDVVPFYASMISGWFISVPWLSESGDFIEVDDAQNYCKPAYIGYLRARGIVLRRFPDTSDKEISLWLQNQEISAWLHEYATARPLNYARYFDAAWTDARSGVEPLPTLNDLLDQCYFSKEALEAFEPKIRWRPYGDVIELAKKYHVDKDHTEAIIRRHWELSLAYDSHTPRDHSGDLPQATEQTIREHLYSSDWIEEIIRNELEPHRAELAKGEPNPEASQAGNETDIVRAKPKKPEKQPLQGVKESVGTDRFLKKTALVEVVSPFVKDGTKDS